MSNQCYGNLACKTCVGQKLIPDDKFHKSLESMIFYLTCPLCPLPLDKLLNYSVHLLYPTNSHLFLPYPLKSTITLPRKPTLHPMLLKEHNCTSATTLYSTDIQNNLRLLQLQSKHYSSRVLLESSFMLLLGALEG